MRRHAPVAEYDAYLERWIDDPVYQRMLRHARDEFLAHYPDLETWFAAPLLERVGRQRRDGVRSSCKTLGYLGLGLNGYAWFDWEWLLAVARHRIWEFDARLRLTLRRDVDAFIQEAVRLGYVRSSSRQSIFWAVSRIVLHAGDPRVAAINETQVDALVEAVRRFGDRSDVALFHGSVERYQRVPNKGYLTHIHALRVVLYHRGQATTEPRRNHRPSGRRWPVHKPRMRSTPGQHSPRNVHITVYEAESVTRVVGRSEVCCSSRPSRITIESRRVPGTTNPKKPMLPTDV